MCVAKDATVAHPTPPRVAEARVVTCTAAHIGTIVRYVFGRLQELQQRWKTAVRRGMPLPFRFCFYLLHRDCCRGKGADVQP